MIERPKKGHLEGKDLELETFAVAARKCVSLD